MSDGSSIVSALTFLFIVHEYMGQLKDSMLLSMSFIYFLFFLIGKLHMLPVGS